MNQTISDHEMYLFFSYLPKFSEASLDWLHCDFEYEFGRGIDDEAWWVSEGVKALKKTFAAEVASTDPKADHIVLLSGGMDSRAILGGLLENLPKSRIIAATYGIPGAWDFEFAQVIARKFGLRHEVINLLEEKWDLDGLNKAAARLQSPVSVYQSHVRQRINNTFGTGCIYWSGFLGDTIGGYNLPEFPTSDKREAILRYLAIEPTPNYKDASFQSLVIEKMLNEFPWDCMGHSKFTLEQQLNFGLRQRQLLWPIVVVNGFTFKAPFLYREWVNFMTSAPRVLVLNQYLYKRVLKESYKELANLPSETGAGLPFHTSKYWVYARKALAKLTHRMIKRDPYSSHPRTNYINWGESLRHKTPLQETVYTTLQDLKKRGIFEDKVLDVWWRDHLDRKMDYTILLMNLSSLELLLKAGVMKPGGGSGQWN